MGGGGGGDVSSPIGVWHYRFSAMQVIFVMLYEKIVMSGNRYLRVAGFVSFRAFF